MPAAEPGWEWFARAELPDNAEARELAVAFARCFASREGEQVLTHLRALTVERCLGPSAPDAALRHIEGQRALVHYIEALTARGRG